MTSRKRMCLCLLFMFSMVSLGYSAVIDDGLIIHLSADNLTGLNDGDQVTTWADAATADSIDGTVSIIDTFAAPVYQSNVLNGHAAVRFNNGQVLSSSQFSWLDVNAGVTVFMVLTGDQSGQDGERAMGIGHATGATDKIVAFDASTNTTAGDGGSGMRYNGGKALVKTNNPLDADYHTVMFQVTQGDTYQNAIYAVDDVTPEAYDNVANGGKLINLPADENVLTVGTSWIKGSIGASDYFTGDIAELIVYNRSLSTAEMTQVNDYLQATYFVPEPVSLIMIGFGGLVVLRRKK